MSKKQLSEFILYEDEDVLVVNKPAGMVTTRSQTVAEITLQDLAEEYLKSNQTGEGNELIPPDFSADFGSPTDIFQQRSGIAHRLDKDTSGALVIAKNPGALVTLLHQFKQRHVQKEYLCLVHGKFSVQEGEISAGVIRDPIKRHQFTVRPEGRPAVTQYQVQQFYPHLQETAVPGGFKRQIKHYQGFSLVVCQPKTGRTHQIRVHMAFVKHPLVGDQTYVGKKRAKLDALWCPRQFLHARALTFTHPRTQKTLTIEAPLAPELQQVLKLLEE